MISNTLNMMFTLVFMTLIYYVASLIAEKVTKMIKINDKYKRLIYMIIIIILFSLGWAALVQLLSSII